jgi:hypothetical protein
VTLEPKKLADSTEDEKKEGHILDSLTLIALLSLAAGTRPILPKDE